MELTSNRQQLVKQQMDISQIQLIYRAEGNANLILALPQYQKVLRLPKTNISSNRTSTNECEQNFPFKTDQSLYKTANSNDISCYEQNNGSGKCNGSQLETYSVSAQDFVSYIAIVRRLFAKEYVYVPEVIAISKRVDRDKIEKICKISRPAHRLGKGFYGHYGLLMPDATLLSDILISNFQLATTDTFAIEIKPKQGWKLPCDTSIFDSRVLEQISLKCRYCAMQYLKLKNGKITKLGGYCPLDLFSGNPSRIKNALEALFVCPQNNLRLFRNGTLLYGDHSESISYDDLKESLFSGESLDTILCLLVQCLLRNYSVNNKFNHAKEAPTDTREDIDEAENCCLPRNCVLQIVLLLQMLARKNLNFMSQSLYNNWKHESYNCVKNLLKRQQNADVSSMKLLPIEEYLLGATALDCSIIVAFHEIHTKSLDFKTSNNQNIVFLPEYGKAFITKVTVVDLDPKPDNHFFNYVQKTNNAYLNAEWGL